MKTKYLLLYPEGGLNDIFVNINANLEYCKKFNRILLVDTNKKYWHFTSYIINFADYFIINDTNIIYDSKEIDKIINKNCYTIYPEEINNLSEIQYKYSKNGYIINNTLLNFDFNTNYSQDIILNVSSFGGDSTNLLNKLEFSDKVISLLKERYFNLPKPYYSVHMRNTDLKIDLENFYNNVSEKIYNKNLYVATDDYESLEFFKKKIKNVYNFTKIPNSKDKNNTYISLHMNRNLDEESKITDCIIDMLLISLSNECFSESKGGYYNYLCKYYIQNKSKVHNWLNLKS